MEKLRKNKIFNYGGFPCIVSEIRRLGNGAREITLERAGFQVKIRVERDGTFVETEVRAFPVRRQR